MLTLTKTDTPVAAYLVRKSERVMGTDQQESMCTSVRRQAHLFPPKIRKHNEKHYGMLPPEIEE